MDNKSNNFSFLTKEQVSRDNGIDIIKKRGASASITDFSMLLGGYYHRGNNNGSYWLDNGDYMYGNAPFIDCYGLNKVDRAYSRSNGARPVLDYSVIRDACSNIERKEDGILEVEYGEYPQQAASIELQNQLNNAFYNNLSTLTKTEKTYSVDLMNDTDTTKGFVPNAIDEYVFSNGKKYVRVCGRSYPFSSGGVLSTKAGYNVKDYVWVEVQPIKWLIDENNNIALSDKILFSGIQYQNISSLNRTTGWFGFEFKNTDIKKYMDEYFAKDIIPSVISEKKLDNNESKNNELDSRINNTVNDAVKYISNPVEETYEELKSNYEELYNTIAVIDNMLEKIRNNISAYEDHICVASSKLFNIDENYILRIKGSLDTAREHERIMKLLRESSYKKMELYNLRMQGKIDTLSFRIKMYELKLQDRFDGVKDSILELYANEGKKSR